MNEPNPAAEERIPLADAIRTTILINEPKVDQIDVGDGAAAAAICEDLLQCMRGWLATLEDQLGQGDVGEVLQVAYDLARSPGRRGAVAAIEQTAQFAGVHLDRQPTIRSVDILGLPTDWSWRERRGIPQPHLTPEREAPPTYHNCKDRMISIVAAAKGEGVTVSEVYRQLSATPGGAPQRTAVYPWVERLIADTDGEDLRVLRYGKLLYLAGHAPAEETQ